MQLYKYSARDPKTQATVSAEVMANDERGAAKLVASRGLTLLDIVPVKSSKSFLNLDFLNLKTRVSTKQWVIYTRQMATMINAGLPLIQTLETVRTQTENVTLKAVTEKIIDDVEGGQSLSTSMGKYPKIFNNVFVSLVAAGEASGTLDTSLERLANQQEKDAEVLSKVRGAFVYPAIVILVMGGIMTFMLLYIFPQVKTYYASLPGANLPFISAILISVSNAMLKFWWLILLLLFGGFYAIFRWYHTSSGIDLIDRLKLRSWPFGVIFNKLYMARFARTGSTLIASGVPLLQMLSIVAQAVGNVHLQKSIDNVASKVRTGKSLSDSMEEDKNFPSLVPKMIRVGEESGSLEGMLDKTASYYEKEVDNSVKTISTIVEPALMIVVGIFAVIMVLAIMLPIYGLISSSKLQ